MIQFDFNIDDPRKYQQGELPENAVKMNFPETDDERMKQSLPIMIALCMLMSGTVLWKVHHNSIHMNFIGCIVGFLIGVVCIMVHELLHAVVYPKQATVTVGKVKGHFLFVALASYPLKRSRFILMSLLPFVLGVIPYLLFVLNVFDQPVVNGIVFGFACVGMISPYPDVFNVIQVLKQAGKENYIMFHGEDVYKI